MKPSVVPNIPYNIKNIDDGSNDDQLALRCPFFIEDLQDIQKRVKINLRVNGICNLVPDKGCKRASSEEIIRVLSLIEAKGPNTWQLTTFFLRVSYVGNLLWKILHTRIDFQGGIEMFQISLAQATF